LGNRKPNAANNPIPTRIQVTGITPVDETMNLSNKSQARKLTGAPYAAVCSAALALLDRFADSFIGRRVVFSAQLGRRTLRLHVPIVVHLGKLKD